MKPLLDTTGPEKVDLAMSISLSWQMSAFAVKGYV